MKDKKSFIFTKEFHTIRLQLADQNQTATNAESNIAGFKGGFFRTIDEGRRTPSTSAQLSSRRTVTSAASTEELYEEYSFLHMAVDDTDPPLACEMLRHGTLIDKENDKGQTPLLQALERIWDLHSVLKKHKGSLPQAVQGYKKQIENAQNRVRYIAVVLIGQHANVNSTVNWQGKVISSLHFACAIEDWDLVTLLLNHGAKSKPTPTCVDVESFLATETAKRRFSGLKANAKEATRPLRLCPCFSGKPMSTCHSERLPYPEDFTCSCGSGKAYGKCCKARNIGLTEIWDEETQWIQPSRTVTIPNVPPSFASPEVHAVMEQVKQNGDMEQVMKMVPEAMFNPDVRSVFEECLELGCQDNIADPAFSFAMRRLKSFISLRPQGRSSSKHWCRQKQKEWNAAVDKYIASGTDSRPRSDIEEAAKVGISLGAMYRACEADGCDKVEGRGIEKVSTCARCKMTFYCGSTCQKLHWRTHKQVCGSVEQTERPLPSQVALSDFVCKFSPALMKYRMGDKAFDGFKFDNLKDSTSPN
ncbi:hypothetical protein DFH09DRAFT_921755 [Mycena vulgaris]|nr:hypothetical protein DFH09DRAFT_921755 [Mycena vulgaris]